MLSSRGGVMGALFQGSLHIYQLLFCCLVKVWWSMHDVKNTIFYHDCCIDAQFSVLLYLGGGLVKRIIDISSAQKSRTLPAILKYQICQATPFLEVPISSKNPPFQKLTCRDVFLLLCFPHTKFHHQSAKWEGALCKYWSMTRNTGEW